MDEKKLLQIAVDTVIEYAEEQGVKLRRLDFGSDLKGDGIHTRAFVIKDGPAGQLSSVIIRITYKGRWERQLKDAKERFLNYVNARLERDWLSFSFTINELEIISCKGKSSENGENIDRVIEKINKLLALSDQSRNNSEQEAIAASLQVQKLLAKYNLTLTDVSGERPEENIEQAITDVGTGKKWKYALSDTIAYNFACKTYIVGKEQIVFYGYKADVIAARRTFIYLFKVGDKLANQVAKRHREAYGYSDGIYNSFCSGFVAGVKKELDKQCKALAIVVQPQVEESFKIFTESFKQIDTSLKVNNLSAYKEGFVEGKRAMNAQYLPD